MKQYSYHKVSTGMFKTLRLALITLGSYGLVACSSDISSSDIANVQECPLDTALNLQCPDEAINTEQCILDNSENPFARSTINETTKFELVEFIPSPKCEYFLWGTALARQANGENQYYTARALHTMYAQGGSAAVQEHAQRAYRALLDHFFLSFTRFKIDTPDGEQLIAIPLKDLVGELIVDPLTNESLPQLFGSQLAAQDALASWGYAYDLDTGILTSDRPN